MDGNVRSIFKEVGYDGNILVMSNRENFTIDYRGTIGDQLSINYRNYRSAINQFVIYHAFQNIYLIIVNVIRIYKAFFINYLQ